MKEEGGEGDWDSSRTGVDNEIFRSNFIPFAVGYSRKVYI